MPDRPALSNAYRVDPAGTVTLPEFGQVSVNGLTLPEASDSLSARLADSRGRRPRVRVEFDRSLQSVFVAGEVRSPGLIAMNGPLSLMKVLARAGSPTPAASDLLVVIHTSDVGEGPPGVAGREPRTRVDIKDLQAGRDVLLHDGDTVYVPKAQRLYILGEVRNPGAYLFDPGMTVLQAVALAGGDVSRFGSRHQNHSHGRQRGRRSRRRPEQRHSARPHDSRPPSTVLSLRPVCL